MFLKIIAHQKKGVFQKKTLQFREKTPSCTFTGDIIFFYRRYYAVSKFLLIYEAKVFVLKWGKGRLKSGRLSQKEQGGITLDFMRCVGYI